MYIKDIEPGQLFHIESHGINWNGRVALTIKSDDECNQTVTASGGATDPVGIAMAAVYGLNQHEGVNLIQPAELRDVKEKETVFVVNNQEELFYGIMMCIPKCGPWHVHDTDTAKLHWPVKLTVAMCEENEWYCTTLEQA